MKYSVCRYFFWTLVYTLEINTFWLSQYFCQNILISVQKIAIKLAHPTQKHDYSFILNYATTLKKKAQSTFISATLAHASKHIKETPRSSCYITQISKPRDDIITKAKWTFSTTWWRERDYFCCISRPHTNQNTLFYCFYPIPKIKIPLTKPIFFKKWSETEGSPSRAG